jgi:hypothetical protein
MSASSVQFRGIDNVVDAYKANRMGPFAILCGKCIIHSSEDLGNEDVEVGAGELRKFLNMLRQGGSEAKYTLQVYRLKDDEEIDSSTPWKRSFNFSLWAAGDMTPYQERRYTETQQLQDRIDVLEKRLAEEMTEEDEEEEKLTIGKVLNGLMEMPQIKNAIAAAAIGLVSKVIPLPNMAAKVAGTDGSQAGQAQSVLTADQVDKANKAMQILSRLDPQLGDNLLKIANIAAQEPVKYQMFAKML